MKSYQAIRKSQVYLSREKRIKKAYLKILEIPHGMNALPICWNSVWILLRVWNAKIKTFSSIALMAGIELRKFAHW